jgi:hypothetical protein
LFNGPSPLWDEPSAEEVEGCRNWGRAEDHCRGCGFIRWFAFIYFPYFTPSSSKLHRLIMVQHCPGVPTQCPAPAAIMAPQWGPALIWTCRRHAILTLATITTSFDQQWRINMKMNWISKLIFRFPPKANSLKS